MFLQNWTRNFKEKQRNYRCPLSKIEEYLKYNISLKYYISRKNNGEIKYLR